MRKLKKQINHNNKNCNKNNKSQYQAHIKKFHYKSKFPSNNNNNQIHS